MSNRMQAFRLEADSPNVLVGGKRPRTTLTPTVVLKDGKPFLAIGTPGGDSQDQQILLVLLNIIDFGMDVQAAIEAPRFNSLHPESSFGDHRAQLGVLEVERRTRRLTLADSNLAATCCAPGRPTAWRQASWPPASTRRPDGCAAAPIRAASAH
jgi:gamma-glutamyltranspeptidase